MRFIDMELCDINLEDYIFSESKLSNAVPHFIKDPPAQVKAAQIWNIMHQVLSEYLLFTTVKKSTGT